MCHWYFLWLGITFVKEEGLFFLSVDLVPISFFIVWFWIVLDHDECNTESHGCQQKCVNMHGTYSCACLLGYELNNDNKTCSG